MTWPQPKRKAARPGPGEIVTEKYSSGLANFGLPIGILRSDRIKPGVRKR